MRKLILSAVLITVPLGGWAAVDRYRDARYEKLCVRHFSDEPICDSGYAAEYHRRCSMLDGPPGFIRPAGSSGAKCVKAWLAWDKEQKPEAP